MADGSAAPASSFNRRGASAAPDTASSTVARMNAKATLPSLALLASVLLAIGTSASAATRVVTSDADTGAGTLRQAIIDADPGDTIEFDLATPAQIALLSTITIDKRLSIDGPGRDALIVRAANVHRVLSVDAGATVNLSGLTLRDGSDRGGGLRNFGTVVLSDCLVTQNDSGDGNFGGGIFNNGDLTVSDCAIVGNIAVDASGQGGGIYSNGTLRIERSTLGGNRAGDQGGAIYNGGVLTVIDSTFSDANDAQNDGGAIANFATLVVDGSTFVDNGVGARGGAIFNISGSLAISNSTFSENDADSGGAIFNNTPMTLTGSTLQRNSAVNGRAIYNFNSAVVSRTIMANTCDGPSPVTSAGDNLVFETPPCLAASEALNDRTGLDPQLQPLADNGGPTRTHIPAPGSPAIDEVRINACAGLDQRGVTRPQGARCDIGAVETVAIALFADGFE